MPLWFVHLLAYLFEFANGWTDAPNSIATVVSTRVLGPLAQWRWRGCSTFSVRSRGLPLPRS